MAGTNLGTAYVTIMPSAKGIKGSISSAIGGEATSAGHEAGGMFAKAFRIAGVAVAAVGIKKFFSEALHAGGELQQSFGGLDTIYGDAAEGMKEMAYEAVKAGISANSYAEQAVSFGAALKQAYGGDLTSAAKAANTAILDMADNSAKMGTEIGMIQNAYQGFARQNYVMLDNLKLGYGGTKKEMQRLLEDATKLSGIEYNIENLGDVYSAIHVIQQSLGLTGVAAAEAEGTFTGSMLSMKAAWENLKADMATGKDITEDLKIIAISAKNFITGNMLPMIGNVLSSLPTLIGDALTTAFTNLPGLVDNAISFIQNLTTAITDNSGEFASGLTTLLQTGMNALTQTDWVGLGSSILNLLWTGIKTVAPMLWEGFKSLAVSAGEKMRSIDWASVGRTIVTFIGNAIGTVGRLIWDALAGIGEKAKEKFKDVDWSEAGKNAFHTLVNGIKEVAETLWDAIKTIFTTAAEHFKDIDWAQVGKDIIQFIANGITAVASFIWEALTSIATSASEFFTNIDWEQAGKDAVQFIINGIKDLASNLWEILTSVATIAYNNLKDIDWKQLGIDILTAIKDGIVAIGSFLWGALQEIGSTAVEWLLDIDWIQSGIDIVNGIIDGIVQFGSNIADTLVGFAKSAWTKLKDFFAIGSPSKLMRDTVGKWIPLGIAEGIEDEADSVTKAMQDMAKDASLEITPVANIRPVAGIRSGISNIVNNFTVNGAENPEDWASRFMRELNVQMRMA